MKRSQYLFILGAIVITLAIYFGTSTKKKETPPETPTATSTTNTARPLVTLNIDSLENSIKRKMSPTFLDSLAKLSNVIQQTENDSIKSVMLELQGILWREGKYPIIAAPYFAKSGKLENSEKKLNFAAHLLTEAMHDEKNALVKQWMAQEAIAYYDASLAIKPNDPTVTIDQALTYIDGLGDVMKGVEIMLDLDRRDSTHVPVNIILGRLAIESGQYDKAIERGEKVLRLSPDNWDGIMFLAEAHKRHGDIAKAKELFQKAKKIANNPEFSKDLDEYLKTF